MAFTFKNDDLKYRDYSWTAAREGDNPKVTGNPDDKLLDRQEGYEVVPFINWFLSTYDIKEPATVAHGHKIEDLLRKCPTDIHSRKNIGTWIAKNWGS